MAGSETKRKCPKCGGVVQFRDQNSEGTTRFKCQTCAFEMTAAELHVDFWGHVHAFINEADKECSRLFMAGDLAGFEKAWLDTETGKVAKLEIYPWFSDATPNAKHSGSKAIREYIQNAVDYYRDTSKVLAGDPD